MNPCCKKAGTRINDRLVECPVCGRVRKSKTRGDSVKKVRDPMIVPVNYTADERHRLRVYKAIGDHAPVRAGTGNYQDRVRAAVPGKFNDIIIGSQRRHFANVRNGIAQAHNLKQNR